MTARDRGEAERQVVAALTRLAETDAPVVVASAATAIVELRRLHIHDGRPDWTGRSPAYQARYDQLAAEAGFVPDDQLAAQLRLALGSAIRAEAPVDDVVALGMVPAGPIDVVAVAARALDSLKVVEASPVSDDDRDLLAGLLRDIRRVLDRVAPPPS